MKTVIQYSQQMTDDVGLEESDLATAIVPCDPAKRPHTLTTNVIF